MLLDLFDKRLDRQQTHGEREERRLLGPVLPVQGGLVAGAQGVSGRASQARSDRSQASREEHQASVRNR